jgi:predicted TPR repeat methyltransferase
MHLVTKIGSRDVDCDHRTWRRELLHRAVRSAVMGFRDGAADCAMQLLKMDPRDRIGAEMLAKSMGNTPAAEADRVPPLRM